jgi:hypothetical protein
MKTKFHNMWIINAYGPTEEKVEDIEDDFYQIVGHIYNALLQMTLHSSHHITLHHIGDFNAKIEKEESW